MARRKGDKGVSTAERIAIIKLKERGVSKTKIAKQLGRSPGLIDRVLTDAKDLLMQNAKWYAEQHIRATAAAAKAGNSKPAEFMLERLRVVEAKVQDTGGFVVNIGVMLPGLGPDVSAVSTFGNTSQVIDSEDVNDQ